MESRTYDRAGRLTEVENAKGGNILSRFTYTLDEVGNPTAVATADGTITYAYDALDRLTEACFAASCPGPADPFIRYAYDAVGNRTTETRPAGTTTYTYNDSDQLTSQAGPGGTVSYTYDANGNQTGAGGRSFTYDLANRLSSTSAGGTTIAYSYDGDGKRLRASSGGQASAKTNYLWDSNAALPLLIREADGKDALLRRYVYGVDLMSMTTGAGTFYYHHDGLGSVANLTSAAGASQWSYTYEPFGPIRTEVRNDSAAPTNLMRFTGEYFDTGTSLYHLRVRQYDPSVGRFLQLDPRAQAITDPYVAAYVYVNDRPTVLIDPSGREAEGIDDDCAFLDPTPESSACARQSIIDYVVVEALGSVLEGTYELARYCEGDTWCLAVVGAIDTTVLVAGGCYLYLRFEGRSCYDRGDNDDDDDELDVPPVPVPPPVPPQSSEYPLAA